MQCPVALTIANIRSYMRDRAARLLDAGLPAGLHRHVRAHLPGQRRPGLTIGWVDEDGSRPPSSQAARASRPPTGSRWSRRADRTPRRPDAGRQGGRDHRRPGRLRRVADAARPGGGAPASITVFTDPSRSTLGGVGLPGGRDASSASSTSAAGRRWSCPSRADRPDRRTSTRSATSCRACSGCRSCRSGSSRRSRWSPTARS